MKGWLFRPSTIQQKVFHHCFVHIASLSHSTANTTHFKVLTRLLRTLLSRNFIADKFYAYTPVLSLFHSAVIVFNLHIPPINGSFKMLKSYAKRTVPYFTRSHRFSRNEQLWKYILQIPIKRLALQLLAQIFSRR